MALSEGYDPGNFAKKEADYWGKIPASERVEQAFVDGEAVSRPAAFAHQN